tara:strand:- start:307 stop:423 length:117 start_codon:yes stop_codon:yes gene_type:complete
MKEFEKKEYKDFKDFFETEFAEQLKNCKLPLKKEKKNK